MKPNENFIKNIRAINEVCDILMEQYDYRCPEVIMFRALRTVVNPQAEITFSEDFNETYIELVRMAVDIIKQCDDPVKWFIERNSAIPPYTEQEINNLRECVNDIIEQLKNMN